MVLRVREIGEQGLLRRLQQFCPTDVVGDDAALLAVAAGKALVVTTDVLVDGVHFSDRTTSAFDVGWRSVAANLSDLAAMGATPLGITVGLSLPGEVEVAWVECLYQGMVACLQPYQTPIVGGDVCRSPVITVAITTLGQVAPAQAIRRSLAHPGDAIVVTGVHGASRAGLELLLHPEAGIGLSESDRQFLIQAHQRPKPRLDIVGVLSTTVPVAGMDSSDGLADAVLQLCRASGVGAVLERDQIPVPRAVVDWVGEVQAMEWALYGGEDFELVLCLPDKAAAEVVRQVEGAVQVGSVTTGEKVVVSDRTSRFPNQVLSLEQGFQHFGD